MTSKIDLHKKIMEITNIKLAAAQLLKENSELKNTVNMLTAKLSIISLLYEELQKQSSIIENKQKNKNKIKKRTKFKNKKELIEELKKRRYKTKNDDDNSEVNDSTNTNRIKTNTQV